VVVFPQCEDQDTRVFSGWESDSPDGQRALKMLDAVEREFNVDRQREILTGWSMGGYGAWNLAASCPERWSAVVVVAGDIDLDKAPLLKNTRVWSFHGMADFGVPIERARKMIDAIRQAGGSPNLTELPEVGHNIGHVVYSEDALYTWMLNPQSTPKPESFVRNAARNPSKAEMGRDFEFPFVPAIEIPDAFYVHLDNSVLESIGYAIPDMVPEAALAGAQPNIHQTSRGVMTQFDIELSGLSYHGQLEQVRVLTQHDGWATLQLGLRNVTLRVAETAVTGRLTSATAGPMDIVIGNREAVWITAQVRPYIEEHQLRLELGETSLNIPDDNWYVTTPSVVGNGLPFLRSRVADGVGRKMVSDAYGRKHEIESQIKATVPQLLAKIETKLETFFATPRIVGSKLPGPTYLPRCLLRPERIKVDETGVAMTLGMTLSRPGINPVKGPVRRITGPPIDLNQLPKMAGLQLGVSGAVCEGMTDACSNAPMTSTDVRELGVRKFYDLCDRRTMTEIVPDLARFGDQLRIRTKFELAEQVSFRGMEGPSSSPVAANEKTTATEGARMLLKVSNLRAVLQIKTSPVQQTWTRCAEFDIHMEYQTKMSVTKPDFERRLFITEMLTDPDVKVTAHFATGYEAQNATLRGEQVAQIFANGWREEGPEQFLHGLCRECRAKDLALGSTRVRLAEVSWSDPYIFLQYRLPRTRITNAGDKPIEYEIRGPLSDWGGPYVLPPGKSHDFPVSYPLTVRQSTAAGVQMNPLPLGTHFVVGLPTIGPQEPTKVGALPDVDLR
jgi:hypothetical protein